MTSTGRVGNIFEAAKKNHHTHLQATLYTISEESASSARIMATNHTPDNFIENSFLTKAFIAIVDHRLRMSYDNLTAGFNQTSVAAMNTPAAIDSKKKLLNILL